MGKKHSYYGKSMIIDLPDFPHTMAFVAFSCTMRNLWVNLCISYMITIRVPKVPFHVFEKLENEIQKFIVRFCFYLNMKNEIQIFDNHYHV